MASNLDVVLDSEDLLKKLRTDLKRSDISPETREELIEMISITTLIRNQALDAIRKDT